MDLAYCLCCFYTIGYFNGAVCGCELVGEGIVGSHNICDFLICWGNIIGQYLGCVWEGRMKEGKLSLFLRWGVPLIVSLAVSAVLAPKAFSMFESLGLTGGVTGEVGFVYIALFLMTLLVLGCVYGLPVDILLKKME
jgi:hypothetical protein